MIIDPILLTIIIYHDLFKKITAILQIATDYLHKDTTQFLPTIFIYIGFFSINYKIMNHECVGLFV